MTYQVGTYFDCTMSHQPTIHTVNHMPSDLSCVDFRLRSLQVLEKKTEKSLAFIDKHELKDWCSVDRYYWTYSLSFIRCIAGKWKTVTTENYPNIVQLHDICLRQTLIRNVLKVRRAIIATDNHHTALHEWDRLWKWL